MSGRSKSGSVVCPGVDLRVRQGFTKKRKPRLASPGAHSMPCVLVSGQR